MIKSNSTELKSNTKDGFDSQPCAYRVTVLLQLRPIIVTHAGDFKKPLFLFVQSIFAILDSILKKEKEWFMPTISMFYGVLIRLFFHDTDKHHVPHIHAEYQGEVAVYSIQDGSVLAGSIPPAKHKLVVAWIEIHQEDLMADWNLAVNGQNPLPIRGLDQ